MIYIFGLVHILYKSGDAQSPIILHVTDEDHRSAPDPDDAACSIELGSFIDDFHGIDTEHDELVVGDMVLQRQCLEQEVEKLRDGISGVPHDATGFRQALANTLHNLGRPESKFPEPVETRKCLHQNSQKW